MSDTVGAMEQPPKRPRVYSHPTGHDRDGQFERSFIRPGGGNVQPAAVAVWPETQFLKGVLVMARFDRTHEAGTDMLAI